MKRILLLSDTHGEWSRVKAVLKAHPAMDRYIHLGDLGFDPKQLPGFVIVQGNHDPSSYGLAQQQILEVEDCRILLLHGHQLEMQAVAALQQLTTQDAYAQFLRQLEIAGARQAKKCGCQVLFHGHTHMRLDQVVEGVRILNPGSLMFNREEPLCASYACVDVDGKEIRCHFHTRQITEE